MEFFLFYLLRASVLLVLFYGLYKIFFSKNTFHHANRFSLLLIVSIVLLLPVFRFGLIPEKNAGPVVTSIMMDLSSSPVTEFVEKQPRVVIPWMLIGMVVFLLGFLFTLIRYLVGLGQIVTIIRTSKRRTDTDNTVLCVTDRNISPFSWMKYIVISHKELSAENRAVIRHEKAHIHLWHSLDMIILDIFTCIFWFNPFSWLLRREIQSVHEYQADEQVLNQGIESTQYQLLLIRKSVGEYKFALANNFHQRDLHKRITMMKKEKTNRKMGLNYAMMLPVLFMAMIILSVPTLNAKTVEKGDTVMVSGVLHDSQGVIAGGIVTIKGTNRGTVTDLQGQFMIKTDIGSTLQFSMINYKTVEVPIEKNENNLVVVLVPEENATGDNKSREDKLEVIGVRQMENSQDVKEKMVLRSVGGKHPLYIKDGEIISDAGFGQIDPDNIESISVLKDKSAVNIYGDKGKDGVILVTTKKAKRDKHPIHFEADSLIISSLGSNSEKVSSLTISTNPNPSFTHTNPNNSSVDEI